MAEERGYKRYRKSNVKILRYVYIIAIVIWLLVVWWLKLYKTNFWGMAILSIPIILFIMAIGMLPSLCRNDEMMLFKANFLSVGLLLALPLLGLLEKKYQGEVVISAVIVLAIMFTMMSLIDVWVMYIYAPIARHIKSIFQCFAIVLMIYSLNTFFVKTRKDKKDWTFAH